jgi:hypothetical protein
MVSPLYRTHTVAQTFEAICNNQTPWVAIGNFLNDWWYYAVDDRRSLIDELLPSASTCAAQRWAAFCAAMVEYLCTQENISFPEWTVQEQYILQEPWFYYGDLDSRSWLLATTPAPFKMRNIFIGDRAFVHKGSVPTLT